MRYPLAKLLLAFFFLSGSMGAVLAQDFPPPPNPPRLVNDFSGTLSPEEIAQLEQKLVAYA